MMAGQAAQTVRKMRPFLRSPDSLSARAPMTSGERGKRAEVSWRRERRGARGVRGNGLSTEQTAQKAPLETDRQTDRQRRKVSAGLLVTKERSILRRTRRREAW